MNILTELALQCWKASHTCVGSSVCRWVRTFCEKANNFLCLSCHVPRNCFFLVSLPACLHERCGVFWGLRPHSCASGIDFRCYTFFAPTVLVIPYVFFWSLGWHDCRSYILSVHNYTVLCEFYTFCSRSLDWGRCLVVSQCGDMKEELLDSLAILYG